MWQLLILYQKASPKAANIEAAILPWICKLDDTYRHIHSPQPTIFATSPAHFSLFQKLRLSGQMLSCNTAASAGEKKSLESPAIPYVGRSASLSD
jgi:hypothetical protein